MNTYDLALNFTLKQEGGDVNDPTDLGGHTRFGISSKTHGDVSNLTLAEAREIYRRDYWVAHDLDRLPPWAGIALFDCLVNHRPKQAIKLLQRAVGATPDGVLGPQTIGQTWQADELESMREMMVQRARLYARIIKRHPKQARFLAGWMARILDLSTFVHHVATAPAETFNEMA